jgi:hypothetical protein
VKAIFDRMSDAAKPLGVELIAREQTLDQLLAKGEITPDRLKVETAAIGELPRPPARRAPGGASGSPRAAEPRTNCPL